MKRSGGKFYSLMRADAKQAISPTSSRSSSNCGKLFCKTGKSQRTTCSSLQQDLGEGLPPSETNTSNIQQELHRGIFKTILMPWGAKSKARPPVRLSPCYVTHICKYDHFPLFIHFSTIIDGVSFICRFGFTLAHFLLKVHKLTPLL